MDAFKFARHDLGEILSGTCSLTRACVLEQGGKRHLRGSLPFVRPVHGARPLHRAYPRRRRFTFSVRDDGQRERQVCRGPHRVAAPDRQPPALLRPHRDAVVRGPDAPPRVVHGALPQPRHRHRRHHRPERDAGTALQRTRARGAGGLVGWGCPPYRPRS